MQNNFGLYPVIREECFFKFAKVLSMECSSMFSVAAFGPRDLGSNPDWFAVLNSNRKLSVTSNKRVWYSSKYCNPIMGTPLQVVINNHLQIWRRSVIVHNAQLTYLNCLSSWYQTAFNRRYCAGWFRRMLNEGEPSKH